MISCRIHKSLDCHVGWSSAEYNHIDLLTGLRSSGDGRTERSPAPLKIFSLLELVQYGNEHRALG